MNISEKRVMWTLLCDDPVVVRFVMDRWFWIENGPYKKMIINLFFFYITIFALEVNGENFADDYWNELVAFLLNPTPFLADEYMVTFIRIGWFKFISVFLKRVKDMKLFSDIAFQRFMKQRISFDTFHQVMNEVFRVNIAPIPKFNICCQIWDEFLANVFTIFNSYPTQSHLYTK